MRLFPTTKAETAQNTITLQVKGMHCPSCETLITEALQETPGVKSAKASTKAGQVTVAYDEKTVSLATIKKAIASEGYTVLNEVKQ